MRPLLVLVLVLGAIGALLFAVFSLDSGGKGKPAVGPENPAPVSRPADGGPATPIESPVSSGQRTAQTSTDRGPVSGGPTPFQYENTFTGTVKNLMGAPVDGAEVTITTFGATDMFFVNDPVDRSKDQTVRTDAKGEYRFRGIEPRDQYSVIVVHPSYARYEGRTVPVSESGPHEEPPIVLKPGATLSGYVRDEAGSLIEDATLYLESFAYQGLDTDAPDRQTVKTNREGFYTFPNVARGQRILTASAKGFGRATITGLVFDKEEILTRDVTLKVSEMICGRVVGPGNEGIPAARVMAVGISNLQQSTRSEVKTSETGEFCFEDLSPGSYNLIATAKGYRQGPHINRVETNQNNVIIELFREATISGRVVDCATGAPIPSSTIRIRFYYGAQQPTAIANDEVYPQNNPDGLFTVPGVPPSDYVVEAQAPGYAPGFSPNFTIQAGKDVGNIAVCLGKGGSMSGRVVDAEGKPVARARVTTHDNEWTDDEFTKILGNGYPTNATSAEVRTDNGGNFTIPGLTPETYQINVTGPGFTLLMKKDIRVTDGGDYKLGDLRLMRGGSVRGTFFDASGKPMIGGSITLRLAEGDYPRNYSTKSGTDGKFVIPNVSPGRYNLMGTRSGGGEANPFTPIADEKNSEVSVSVSEGEATAQDLHLTD